MIIALPMLLLVIRIVVTALLLPWLVLRFQSWDSTHRKFPLFIVFLISFGPLYVASLGPYYFLVVNVLPKGTAKGDGVSGGAIYMKVEGIVKEDAPKAQVAIDGITYYPPRV